MKTSNPRLSFFQVFISVTSIAFYLAGLFTVFNVLQRLFSIDSVSGLGTIIFLQFLFLCFASLDFFIGYGLSNRKQWTLAVVIISFISISALNLSRYLNLPPADVANLFVLLFPTVVLGIIAVVLFLNRKFLSGTLIDKKVVVSFSLILLTTIMFNKTIELTLYHAK